MTIEQYRLCVRASTCAPPDSTQGPAPRALAAQCNWDQDAHVEDQVNCVDQDDHVLRLSRKRLPSIREMDFVMGRHGGSRFPWGNDAATATSPGHAALLVPSPPTTAPARWAATCTPTWASRPPRRTPASPTWRATYRLALRLRRLCRVSDPASPPCLFRGGAWSSMSKLPSPACSATRGTRDTTT